MDDWKPETPKFLERLSRLLSDIAGCVLVGMMLITVYDIVGRSTGLGSLEPVVELTTMGVVVIASFGLAITTIKSGHVIIDLFTRNNKDETNRRIDAVWLILMAIMLMAMAWLSYHEGMVLHGYNTTTEILQWSVLAYYLPPVLGWGVGAVVALKIGITALSKKRSAPRDGRGED